MTNVEDAAAFPCADVALGRRAPACAAAARDWRASPAPHAAAAPPRAAVPARRAAVAAVRRAAVAAAAPRAPALHARAFGFAERSCAPRLASRFRTRHAHSAAASEWPWRNRWARADARAVRRRSRFGTFPEAADGSRAHRSNSIVRGVSPQTVHSRRGVLQNASWCSRSRVAYPPKAGRVPRSPGCASPASRCHIKTWTIGADRWR